MTLQDACVRFLEARDTIMALAPKDAPNFAVTHNGKAAFFKVDPIGGVGVAVHPCLGATAPTGSEVAAETKAETPAAPDKPKRGRPAKAAQEIETKSAKATAVTVPATPVEWTNDKLRALARSVKDKIGLEKTRELIGAQIDDLKPEQYAATAAKLQAKLDEVAAPKPEEL